MHLVLGPAALLVIAVITVGVVQEGGAPLGWDVAGLVFTAAVLFGIPLAIMRSAWVQARGKRPIEQHPVARSESPWRAAHPRAEEAPPRKAA
ncbi:MAG TPA: hypothetical protein VM841_15440 [Actinomycetota bacterium]|nr:hypothetical protein [Actinomycetota bacterium]